eukprot:15476422-Alexandrium_andersonii.AAC.1
MSVANQCSSGGRTSSTASTKPGGGAGWSLRRSERPASTRWLRGGAGLRGDCEPCRRWSRPSGSRRATGASESRAKDGLPTAKGFWRAPSPPSSVTDGSAGARPCGVASPPPEGEGEASPPAPATTSGSLPPGRGAASTRAGLSSAVAPLPAAEPAPRSAARGPRQGATAVCGPPGPCQAAATGSAPKPAAPLAAVADSAALGAGRMSGAFAAGATPGAGASAT